MPFVTTNKVPKKLSDVCLALNVVMTSDSFHEALAEYKHDFPGSNIDGPTLSSELMRVFKQDILVSSTWMVYGMGIAFNGKIYINSRIIGGSDALEIARAIASLSIVIVDERSAFWFDPRQSHLDRRFPGAHAVVGNLALRSVQIREVKGGDRHGLVPRIKTKEDSYHLVD